MIEIDIPGFNMLHLEHLVMDYNGTLALDGRILQGVKERLYQLAEKLTLHVLTADTFGNVQIEIAGLPCELVVLPTDDQANEKMKYVQKLGCEKTVYIGNGRNDRLMLKKAIVGIVTAQDEGAASEAIQAADVVVSDIMKAFELLLFPLRLKATLRS